MCVIGGQHACLQKSHTLKGLSVIFVFRINAAGTGVNPIYLDFLKPIKIILSYLIVRGYRGIHGVCVCVCVSKGQLEGFKSFLLPCGSQGSELGFSGLVANTSTG